MRKQQEKFYFVNLDALRFIAALSVVVFHYFSFLQGQELLPKWLETIDFIFKRGHLGVHFFFVLSGFLIFFLFFQEIQRTGKFHPWNFLVRRTLRIWPLFFFVIGCSFLLVHRFPIYGPTQHEAIYFAFFLSNFNELKNGLTDAYTLLTVPWSVSIEEQFYLSFALLVIFWKKVVKYLPILLLFLLCFSLVFQGINYFDDRVRYYHTFSALGYLAIGGLLAWGYFYHKKKINRYLPDNFILRKFVLVLFFVLILLKNKILHHGAWITLELLYIGCIFAWVILYQIQVEWRIPKKIKHYIDYFGRISYGIYMYHMLVFFFLELAIQYDWINSNYAIYWAILSGLMTLLISHFSFVLLEKPFLKWKNKFYAHE